MTQRDRHRLVVLKKAQKKLITQRQAASELDVSERHVRRLLVRLKEVGEKALATLRIGREYVCLENQRPGTGLQRGQGPRRA